MHNAQPKMKDNYYHMPAEQLVDFVIELHDDILMLAEQIQSDFAKFSSLEHGRISAIAEAQLLFQNCAHKIKRHLQKEATAVLPFAKRYAKALEHRKFNAPALSSSCGAIQKMYQEHKEEILPFALIYYMLRKANPPEAYHPFLRHLCASVLELKNLWQQQVELENDVLFPKIIEMESVLYPM